MCYGGDEARRDYDSFTARHPRFRVTQAKRWGVALLEIPGSFDDYLGSSSAHRRRKWKHARSAGFRYARVEPSRHLDEILEINRSAPVRQGHAMSDLYVDPAKVAREHESDVAIHAILDARGRLRAYAVAHDLGDAVAFSKVIGHADDLNAGVVHLLVCEVVRECIEARNQMGRPTWLMYDTFWGATEGLAYFKTRLGFEPRTVDWVWTDRPVATPAAARGGAPWTPNAGIE